VVSRKQRGQTRGQRCNRKNGIVAVEGRRQRVAELYVQGYGQWQIARAIGVDQATVSRDLAALRADWLESTRANFDERMAHELARLAHLELQAWESFHLSREPIATGRKGPPPRARPGDPRFLAIALQCITTRLRLLGATGDSGPHDNAPLPRDFWDKCCQPPARDLDPIEQRIASVGRQDHAPPRPPTPALPKGLILLPPPSKNGATRHD
jgi:hypothetical protein